MISPPSRCAAFAPWVFAALLVLLAFLAPGLGSAEDVAPPLGLDHVPVVVHDLKAAKATYDNLGFRLKPGRLHKNTLENVHVKFPDGTALELLSVARRADAQASMYFDLLDAGGEQAAFLAFDVGRVAGLGTRLKPLGHKTIERLARPVETLTFVDQDPLRYLFFVDVRKPSPDLPEHFDHPNGALRLEAVWLAAEDLDAELELLSFLGGDEPVVLALPGLDVAGQEIEGRVLHLDRGSVYLLPPEPFGDMPSRIVGVTIAVADLEKAREAMRDGMGEVEGVVEKRSATRRSFLVPPAAAHGLWIEFLEIRSSDTVTGEIP